ncbi:hypothetical protein [Streptomyces sp. DH10]|uniref:hypothetical protein n=1 Tax=Streptomyces sp. DH10 TaxID=3040121 RepID=UPI00244319FB|nr:hypothetical protein [Streptomyces sp. DH10]MDG9713899.1 hypothetical protein [Streptomyces sp. DH10]
MNSRPDPIPSAKIGGTLTSIKAVQRRVGPAGAHQLLQRDERVRLYRIDRVLREGLQRAYVLADARPDLPRFTSSAESTCRHCASPDRLADRLPAYCAKTSERPLSGILLF